MLMQQLLALKPAQVVEQTLEERYEESSDFDADMDKIQNALEEAKKIVNSANFQRHMKDTDENFDTSTVEMGRRALDKLQLAIEAFEKFYTEMEQAA